MDNKRSKYFRSQFTETNSTRGTFEIYLKPHDFGFEYSRKKIKISTVTYARTFIVGRFLEFSDEMSLP